MSPPSRQRGEDDANLTCHARSTDWPIDAGWKSDPCYPTPPCPVRQILQDAQPDVNEDAKAGRDRRRSRTGDRRSCVRYADDRESMGADASRMHLYQNTGEFIEIAARNPIFSRTIVSTISDIIWTGDG